MLERDHDDTRLDPIASHPMSHTDISQDEGAVAMGSSRTRIRTHPSNARIRARDYLVGEIGPSTWIR
jgi:hypothetical protein